MAIGHVFVYGTLLPGDVRFPRLAPFVVDDGWPDTIEGRLFDTGEDYPAALLADAATTSTTSDTSDTSSAVGRIHGRTFALLESSAEQALEVLDEVEGVVAGAYRRVAVLTSAGVRAWVYEYGGGLPLTPIESGDWATYRPPSLARPLTEG